MLLGRWLLFFGFIWVVMNIVVSAASATGAGSDTARFTGFVAQGSDFLIVGGSARNVQEALRLNSSMTAAEGVEDAGGWYERAIRIVSDAKAWGTMSWPGVLEGPVWGMITTIWAVFGGLLAILALATIKSFLPFLN